ncbi:MAG: T9SS type A sorting domain-containing protein [Flavobacteriales bacterium]|jgi:hypothetical protein|nr:T9SS type A sorting domain-containing protein [Flavobacteriales bacterium]MBT3964862.1 T9SS type A sorting domain-containing protein [Flavobacteriales bacterium]MBT4705433.1 T9SS type A sorting domain-containing protein [Flavobacteriales bacterium]MBT4930456.1 T9SS type A sorting domain-containing protein [Flavobacteriales bacterium]MBT5131733.1 T9SS type A sorting domain-containing protein [Flavobacteriales bacterium]
MKLILSLMLVLSAHVLDAQIHISDLIKVADAQEYGDMRPRIELVNGTPNVFWMQNNSRLWLNHRTSDSIFSDPVNLNGADHSIFVSNYGGSDIAVSGSTMFLTYMILPYIEAKVYLKKSVDGGETWSDPELIALPDSVIPFVPTVAVDELGDPVLMVMAYDENYHNPEWVTLKSFDGGSTFQSMVSASEGAPHEVCDCCPGNLNVWVDQVVTTFRNNDQNIRDTWIATSHDWGAQYDTVLDVDPGNWNIASCPSSGPDAIFDGNRVHSTWMSSGSGSPRIYYSNMHSWNYEFESGIVYESGNSQNFPRIAGNTDTIGIVFQNSDNGISNCLFIHSINGGETWSEPLDVYGDSVSYQRHPDVAFENGSFHIIFNDLFTSSIYYREVSFNAPSGVSTTDINSIRLYPNPVKDLFRIELSSSQQATIDVHSISGELIHHAQILNGDQIDCSAWNNGVYFVEIRTSDGISLNQKLVLVK